MPKNPPIKNNAVKLSRHPDHSEANVNTRPPGATQYLKNRRCVEGSQEIAAQVINERSFDSLRSLGMTFFLTK